MKKLAFLLMIAFSAGAQASPPTILGSLSNFDVYNNTGSDKSGFEIDLEDLHKSDLASTWCYSAFGCGTGYDTTSGGKSVLAVVHDGGSKVVANGAKTHFGVHLYGAQSAVIRYDWLDRLNVDGLLHHTSWGTALAPGQSTATPIPVPVKPADPPHPAPIVLTPHWTFNSGTGMWDISIQNTLGRDIWVQLGGTASTTAVSLDQLMTDNPLITGTTNDRYELLTAGQSITESEDIQGATVAGVAKFFASEYTGPLDDAGNAYCSNWVGTCNYIDINGISHSIDAATTHGAALGNIMTAANFAAVPVPAAVWLFGSGLVGLVGVGRKRKTA